MQIHHDQAQQADGNIEEKNYSPVRVAHNQSAGDRPQHRRHQSRNRNKAHHAQQVRPGKGPHQRQPAYGHHHGPAHALDDAAGNEQMNVAAQPAEQRPQCEQPNGRSKYAPCSKPVCHPSADGNKHRERQSVAGQYRLHCERAHMQRLGNRRHRRIQNRRIQRFHEKGDRYQPGQQPEAGRWEGWDCLF